MLKPYRSELLALSFGAVFAIAISPNAFAAENLSYEQAWVQCNQKSIERYLAIRPQNSAGGACMHTVRVCLKEK